MAVTNMNHAEKVLDYIETTGAVLEKAAAMVAAKEAQEKKCAELIPLAVEALLKNERMEPHQKAAAEIVLKDPAKVLEVLIKTASHRNDSERSQLGEPVEGQTKKASYNSVSDGYVGRRARPSESESDKAFKKGLGL
jgi:hypothetical protein